MGVKEFFLRSLAKKYGFTDSVEYIEALGKIGSEADVPFPTDLAPMAGRMFTRGVFTQMAIQPNLDGVLPYWAVRQYDPHDAAFIPRMTWVQFNLTHRNWTAVGLPGSTREVVVDPRGWVTPWFEGWSLDAWLDYEGQMLYPSREKECRQRQIENLPLVTTVFDKPDFRFVLETFVTTIDGIESVLVRATVANKTNRTISPALYFSVRPFNPEGASLVKSIEALDDRTLAINGALGVQFHTPPQRIHCSDRRDGDCAFYRSLEPPRTSVKDEAGLATAYAMYPLRLEAGQEQDFVCIATVRPEKITSGKATRLRAFDYYDMRADAKAVWREKLHQGMNLELPDKAMTDQFYLCKSHLMLADDGDSITPGPMTYHHYWFRDSAYMITALDRMGLHIDARRKLMDYPHRQLSDGFFQSQPGEWDSAGQAIWTLVEHFRITGDRPFLEKMFVPLVRGGQWIVRTRKKQTTEPAKGLLPPGFSAEHLGPNDFYYWDDFWGLAGLRDVSRAGEVLGKRDTWVTFEREAEAFLEDIRTSLQHVERRLGIAAMPAGPYRRLDCGIIGSIAALYPLRLLDPFDPLITNSLEALHDGCMFENGFFSQMIHAGINMYLTLHIAHCHLLRRETRAWPLIKYVLGKATSVGTWPEAIHPATGGGCMGDGMHLWAAADWLLTLRDLLLFEDGDRLVLTPAPLYDWFEWGNHFEVNDAPTHFGMVSFRVEGREGDVVLNVDAAWRQAPLKIEWNLPFPIGEALVDGKPVNVNDTRILVPGGTREVRVKRV